MRRINLFSYGMMSLLKLFARVLRRDRAADAAGRAGDQCDLFLVFASVCCQ